MTTLHKGELAVNGTTGKIIEADVDGKPAKIDTSEQPILLEVDMEALVHDLSAKQRDIRAAKSEAGKARKKVQDLTSQRDGIIAELERRAAKAHGIQLEFTDEEVYDEESEDE